MRGTVRKLPRLLAVATISVALVALATPGSARPTRQELDAAKAELSELIERVDVLVEEYDAALVRVRKLEGRLEDLRLDAAEARRAAERAESAIDSRAAEVYMRGPGTALDLLFGATTLTEFTERLEFLDALSDNDSELATRAEVTREHALRSAEDLSRTLAEQRAVTEEIAGKKAAIDASLAEQRELVARLERQFNQPIRVDPPAIPVAEAPLPDLPPASAGAQAAIAAAYSVLGTPYQYGGADPSTGFDCSGLTMWSWAQAGVSLPHSSAAQYAALPHVPQEDLQPGDLLFFYTPIHHVGMYLGGGNMIHSPHTGGVVEIIPVYWEYYVGGGRPGV